MEIPSSPVQGEGELDILAVEEQVRPERIGEPTGVFERAASEKENSCRQALDGTTFGCAGGWQSSVPVASPSGSESLHPRRIDGSIGRSQHQGASRPAPGIGLHVGDEDIQTITVEGCVRIEQKQVWCRGVAEGEIASSPEAEVPARTDHLRIWPDAKRGFRRTVAGEVFDEDRPMGSG